MTAGEQRRLRGEKAVALHPDFGDTHPREVATDIIADVLQWLDRHLNVPPDRWSQEWAEGVLERALRTWVVDQEDNDLPA